MPRKWQRQALTPRQERFVACYLQTLNASEAARAGGYEGSRPNAAGMSMLRAAPVAEAIATRRAEEAKTARLSTRAVLEQLAAMAFLDGRELADEQGRARPVHELPADVAGAVEVVPRDDGVLVARLPAAARVRALELLGRHLALFVDRTTVNVEGLDWRALLQHHGEERAQGPSDGEAA
jgi:phage terminase small subunit